jgi:hypothetical protein
MLVQWWLTDRSNDEDQLKTVGNSMAGRGFSFHTYTQMHSIVHTPKVELSYMEVEGGTSGQTTQWRTIEIKL